MQEWEELWEDPKLRPHVSKFLKEKEALQVLKRDLKTAKNIDQFIATSKEMLESKNQVYDLLNCEISDTATLKRPTLCIESNTWTSIYMTLIVAAAYCFARGLGLL